MYILHCVKSGSKDQCYISIDAANVVNSDARNVGFILYINLFHQKQTACLATSLECLFNLLVFHNI